ncbi:hypothetical protein MBAV_004366 [Candidatus Magnetobacterium bavaricum]|uniref:Uncharacterized protein n=1 Tax=Candidatus Magnetobacterium bavaricum TaxID=29290 RepID=A0A0F3GNC8_9BACT|nr:hypothetical protein MBAV_004366 [Candidatus Magnetobacterium bavaricum]
MNEHSHLNPLIFVCDFVFIYEHEFISVATINHIGCYFKLLHSCYIHWYDF